MSVALLTLRSYTCWTVAHHLKKISTILSYANKLLQNAPDSFGFYQSLLYQLHYVPVTMYHVDIFVPIPSKNRTRILQTVRVWVSSILTGLLVIKGEGQPLSTYSGR